MCLRTATIGTWTIQKKTVSIEPALIKLPDQLLIC